MTTIEARAIRKLIENGQRPYARGGELDPSTGKWDHHDEAHLLKSEDYLLGFQRCHERYQQTLKFILTASPKDLLKYAGSPRKEKKS